MRTFIMSAVALCAGLVLGMIFPFPYGLIAAIVVGITISITWNDIWAALTGERFVNLSDLGRQAGLPEGWVLLSVEIWRNPATRAITRVEATIGSLRGPRQFKGEGLTEEDAVRQAANKARLYGGTT